MIRTIRRCARGTPKGTPVLCLGGLAVVIVVALGSAQGIAAAGDAAAAGKWGGPIDPDALQILKGMTDYLGSLQQFAMHTENTYEDVLETGQKIQFGFSTDIVVQRPDKMRAERTAGTAHQLFIYDGAKLSIHETGVDFFATVDVPDSIDDFLHFARDTLGLVPPAGDMIFSNSFELLTAGVTSGFVVGEAKIGGVRCHHLAFTTPVVDWQVWIAEGDSPLPYKYVLTTRDDPAQPQFVTAVSNWNTMPKIADGTFTFDPPSNAMEIDFIRADAGTESAR
jgi:hypothetical protein